jgi:DNA-binding HxlR family transcriptional regulator
MLKLNFWKKEKPLEKPVEAVEEKPREEVVLDQKSLEIGSSLGELNQKFDKLSAAIGQCFLAIDNKIDSYKDNIVVIEDGITKQVEQHNEFKESMESYENKILRLIRNLRSEIEAEIGATNDDGTKQRLGNTVEKINSSLVLNLIKERGPIETSMLEQEVISRKICSKATLFRKLKTLREKGFVQKEDKNGQVFYSVSADGENKEDSPENLENA